MERLLTDVSVDVYVGMDEVPIRGSPHSALYCPSLGQAMLLQPDNQHV